MGVLSADARRIAPVEIWCSALVLALFATLLAIVGPRHEAWFDEAQSWLIGRDTTLWDLLAHRLRYEGTPGLWHALLWFAAHVGLPFAHLWMISAALALVGAWVILTRAPFPYWLRVGAVFSYFMAYQYAIVARSYALDLALIPLIAASFADRLRRPVLYGVLLGLLANANAHSFLIAGVVFAEFVLAMWQQQGWAFWRWRRAELGGAAIYAALAVVAALTAWPPADASYLSTVEAAGARGVQMMTEAFVDRLDIWSTTPTTDFSWRSGILATAVLLAPTLVLFQRAGARVLALTLALFAVLIGFSIAQFSHVWHAGVLYLTWLLALWIAWNALPTLSPARRRVTVAAVGIIVFVNVYYTGAAALRDFREPYSAAPAAARALSDDARVAAIGFKAFAVQPWFTANLFRNYHDGAPGETYYAWKLGEPLLPYVAYSRWREAAADSRYDTLLLSTHKVPDAFLPRFLQSARAAGYCGPTAFSGGLVWKSYVMESDDLLVFRRCPGGIAGLQAQPANGSAAR